MRHSVLPSQEIIGADVVKLIGTAFQIMMRLVISTAPSRPSTADPHNTNASFRLVLQNA